MTSNFRIRYELRVTSNSIAGLTDLNDEGSNIFWISSSQKGLEPEFFRDHSTVRMASFKQAIGFLNKNNPKAIIVLIRDKFSETIPKSLIQRLKEYSGYKMLILSQDLDWESLSGFEDLINLCGFSKILAWPKDNKVLRKSIEMILTFKESGEAPSSTKSSLSPEHLQLEKTKSLVHFVKAISSATRLDGVLRCLWQDAISFKQLKAPMLAFANTQNQFQLMYMQGSEIMTRAAADVWSQNESLRWNDPSDSQYLANIFGRPFAQLLSVPLDLRRKSFSPPLKVSALLFFEHSLSESVLKDFILYLQDRLQPLSIALDRLLLEQDLIESSFVWEKTFDGLKDPVAIFDISGQIVRANRAFSDHLSDIEPIKLKSLNFTHKNHIYDAHTYNINLGSSSRPSNTITRYVDITFEHRLNQQMIQNEKMVALGHLAGNIAHELNNPLTGVRSLAQILLTQVPKDSTLSSDLNEVEKATERCQQIIRNLLEFSSGGIEKKQESISLNEIVHRTLPLLKTLISRYEVRLDLSPENCDVFVEPHLMQQVVFNIIKNACQAMGEKGILHIQTERSKLQQAILLKISDSGPGIPEQLKNQIFDFFFTTKDPGQGTGLGLSMSKSIVDRFGGQITIADQAQRGALFIVSLPWANEV